MRPTARVFDGTALVTHALHTVSQPGRHAAIDFGLQMQFAMNVMDTDRVINRPEVNTGGMENKDMTNEDDEMQAAELARLESLIESIIAQDDERGLALIPTRIVAEVMEALDPERISHPALYAGCRHHVRQVVCSILGIDDEPEDVAEKA